MKHVRSPQFGRLVALVLLVLAIGAACLPVIGAQSLAADNQQNHLAATAAAMTTTAVTPPAPPSPVGGSMTITQTLSDGGQRNTIAFDGLAFLTGNLGADSFFPPGKVADFWGFQYLRDNDPTGMGHTPIS